MLVKHAVSKILFVQETNMETNSTFNNHMELSIFPAASLCSEDLEMMVVRRDREILHLREEVYRLQQMLQEIKERTANHITQLQQQLTNKTQDIQILQAKLDSQQDYMKIKAELSSLQTAGNPRDVQVSDSPSDVNSISERQSAALYVQPIGDNDPVVKMELKTPVEIDQESLNESSAVNRRSSSSSSSLYLQTAIKEEHDITYLTSQEFSQDCFLKHSISDESEVYNTQTDEFMDQDEDQLDTTRITQQVKEILQTHNIAQRVFAHYVLGLSQGTVSDILSRPKPWNKLTVRGREPFIRIKHFLSDANGIQTLRNIQDRLRVEEYDRRPSGDGDTSDNIIRNILEQAKQEMSTSTRTTKNICTTQCDNSMMKPKDVDSGRLDPSSLSRTVFVQSIIQKVQSEIDTTKPLHSRSSSLSSIDCFSGQGTSQIFTVESDWSKQGLYNKMASVQLGKKTTALEEVSDDRTGINTSLDIEELDTFNITKRVKEVLTVNNIGQRLFGEAVLGLTQSSVSELLSHPKPWRKLSVKGKENFIRMNLWLQDPRHVQKLNTMKIMGQRAHLKRSLIGSESDTQGTTLDAMGSKLGVTGCSGPFDVSKKQRAVFTPQEKEILKKSYQQEPYPSQKTIKLLAKQLGLKISTVHNWFNNYRSRSSRRDSCYGGRSYEPVHKIQSPTSPKNLDASLVTIKREPVDARIEEDAGLQRDEEHSSYVSVGVQSDMRIKREKADESMSPGPSLWGMHSSNNFNT
nr:homeobox protein cut-like 1 [Misgurnus anguillicaudatus]